MERSTRAERIAGITAMLVIEPWRARTLQEIGAIFGVAKSTLCEDLAAINDELEKHGLGTIHSLPGAAGGVRYRATLSAPRIRETVADLCRELSAPDRVLRGGFLYMTDILLHPTWTFLLGRVFATAFGAKEIDCVVTVETKGIPVGLMTARALDVPLVVLRRDHRVTEGPAVSINYLSGSTSRIQTMSLARRALPPQARVVLIDDFMRAGGTARGMMDMMAEFGAQVRGMGVVVETAVPRQKLVSDYISLVILEGIDERARQVKLRPSSWVEAFPLDEGTA